MSQWGVQLVIGKLITDEEFRLSFEAGGRDCLTGLSRRGVDLSDAEIAALVDADPRLWSRTATRIDSRLKRVRPREAQRIVTPLTAREQQVLRGVFEGQKSKEISAHLGVSESAVKATLQQLFRKAHVHTRAQLVRMAVEGSLGVTRTAPRRSRG